jgi:hypothetical protein
VATDFGLNPRVAVIDRKEWQEINDDHHWHMFRRGVYDALSGL